MRKTDSTGRPRRVCTCDFKFWPSAEGAFLLLGNQDAGLDVREVGIEILTRRSRRSESKNQGHMDMKNMGSEDMNVRTWEKRRKSPSPIGSGCMLQLE